MSVSPGTPAELEALLQQADVGSVDDLPAPSVALQPSFRPELQRQSPNPAALATLYGQFVQALTAHGIEFDAATSLDLLCGILSSQFILLAGPSGTGKSTAAAALQGFFVPDGSASVVEGRRQLVGPEDLVGYYTALGTQYVRAPDLKSLLRLGGPGDANAASPCLLVEEINLSLVEGYLAPLMHGLSTLSKRSIDWQLHDANPTEVGVPQALCFAPFPRLIGTINVDATAAAPSPKVAARACVVLLEPVEAVDVQAAFASFVSDGGGVPWQPDGAPFVHDPGAAVGPAVLATLQGGLLAAIDDLIKLVRRPPSQGAGSEQNVVTRRQVAQMIQYGSWFALVTHGLASQNPPGPSEGDRHKWAAENALLHFVLPSLSPEEFTRVLALLSDPGRVSPPPPPEALGSVLASRVTRLSASVDESLMTGQVLDFWDRLS